MTTHNNTSTAPETESPLDQLLGLMQLLKEKGLTKQRLARLIRSGILSDVLEMEKPELVDRTQFRLSIMPGRMKMVTFSTFLNYQEPLERKVSTFPRKSRFLTDQNFTAWWNDPAAQSWLANEQKSNSSLTQARAIAVWFGVTLLNSKILSWADSAGFRPAIPKELADVSNNNSEAKFRACLPMAALGDKDKGKNSWKEPSVATIMQEPAGREIGLTPCPDDREWDDSWWFLFFYK